MPDEYPLGVGSSDDSPTTGAEDNQQPEATGDPLDQQQPLQLEDGNWQWPTGEITDADGNLIEPQEPETGEPAETTPVAAAQQAQEPAAPTYTPPQPFGMSQDLQTRLSVYLPEEDVKALGEEIRQVAVQAAQQALMGRDQHEVALTQMGVPAAYQAEVRRYLPQVQQSVQDPAQAVQAAIQYVLYERAVRNGNNLVAEMQRYVEAAGGDKPTAGYPAPAIPQPQRPATQPAAPQRPKPKVQPLHPDAQPTRSAIQGTPVRQPVPAGARRGTREDPVYSHFPGLKPRDEE